MRISGKGHVEPKFAREGGRAFYGLFGRPEAADQDISFVLQVNQPGSGTEDDNHDLEQWFFVHKGCCRFYVDGEAVVAGPGDLVYVPRNAMHHHEVVGDEAAELVVIDHWPHDSENELGWE